MCVRTIFTGPVDTKSLTLSAELCKPQTEVPQKLSFSWTKLGTSLEYLKSKTVTLASL